LDEGRDLRKDAMRAFWGRVCRMVLHPPFGYFLPPKRWEKNNRIGPHPLLQTGEGARRAGEVTLVDN
jgi:hypothetical protein